MYLLTKVLKHLAQKIFTFHIVYVIFRNVITRHGNGCLFYSISRIFKIYFSLKAMNVIVMLLSNVANHFKHQFLGYSAGTCYF